MQLLWVYIAFPIVIENAKCIYEIEVFPQRKIYFVLLKVFLKLNDLLQTANEEALVCPRQYVDKILSLAGRRCTTLFAEYWLSLLILQG